ncbi:MAG: hypothetical protein ACRDHP_08185 [Ktedonobacterales bacterium]
MLTYIDSGVLIAAARKATYHKRVAEADFYNLYFDAVQTWIAVDALLIQLALQRGAEFGLNGMDAIHVAAAETAGAAEFLTTERSTSPLVRVTTVHVVSLHP